LKILKNTTGRRPVYFKRPAWPVRGLGLACLACDRRENYGLCLSQAGRHRQAGRPDGLFGPLREISLSKVDVTFFI